MFSPFIDFSPALLPDRHQTAAHSKVLPDGG